MSNHVNAKRQRVDSGDDCVEIFPQIKGTARVLSMNQMPTNVLALILKKIKLQERIRLRKVCTKWRATIEEICASNKSLKLFLKEKNDTGSYSYSSSSSGSYWYSSYYLGLLDSKDYEVMKMKPIEEDDSLRLISNKKSPSDCFASILFRIFPKVEILVIAKETFTESEYALLNTWPNLQILTVCGHRMGSGYDFCEYINELQHLRRVNLTFMINKKYKEMKPMAYTLERVEGVSIKTHADIKSFLCKFKKNKNLTHLQMGRVSKLNSDGKEKVFFNTKKLKESLPAHLLSNLTHLMFTEFHEIEMLRYIYKSFVNLQYLGIQFADYKRDVSSPMELFKLLNKDICAPKNLREVKFLKINFSLGFTSFYKKPPAANSVKIFKISNSGYNYDDFETDDWTKKIAEIFPKLEQLFVQEPYGEDLFEDIETNKGKFNHLKVCKFIKDERDDI